MMQWWDKCCCVEEDDTSNLAIADLLEAERWKGPQDEEAMRSPAASREFVVTVVGLRSLTGPGWLPKANMPGLYCLATVKETGEVVGQTAVVSGTDEPFWWYELPSVKLQASHTLLLEVHLAGADSTLFACASLTEGELQPNGFMGEIPLSGTAKETKVQLKVKAKIAGGDYPKGATSAEEACGKKLEFPVTLQKEAGALNFRLHCCDVAVVHELRPGPAVKWNEANPLYELKVLDTVIAVNGVRLGPPEMVEAISKGGDTVQLTLQRKWTGDEVAPSAFVF